MAEHRGVSLYKTLLKSKKGAHGKGERGKKEENFSPHGVKKNVFKHGVNEKKIFEALSVIKISVHI